MSDDKLKQQYQEQRERADAAEARVTELEAEIKAVPVGYIMREYPKYGRWYIWPGEIAIRKWLDSIGAPR